MEIEEMKGGKSRIVVSEIPYQVQKSTLISKIADLVKNNKLEDITDLRDESSRNEIRIIIELKKGAIAKKVENRLYKYTPLQNTFNTNMVALIDNEPKLMTLKMVLEEFVKHRQEVVVRRTIYLLKKAKAREHILQGLKIALDNLDEVIKLIRNSKDADYAKQELMKRFELSEIQAQAILDMQLRRLAALERQKIEDELKEIIETIEGYEELLISPEKIMDVVEKELVDLKEQYGDERRSKVVKGKAGKISEADLVVNEDCLVTISESGYIKRMGDNVYRTQGRGGTGVSGAELKDEDYVSTIRTCQTHDWALFFTNTGKVYKMRVWEIPEYSRKAKGMPIINFLSIPQEEKIEAFLTVSPEQMEAKEGFVFFATEKGKVKKTSMDQYENIRSSGIIAIRLKDKDSLVFCGLTTGDNDILLTTAEGQSIRFHEKDVRSMGRTAGGVSGIKLKGAKDRVVGAIIIPDKSGDLFLTTVSEMGYGKKTSLTEYKVQNRGGSGIITYKPNEKTGKLVSAREINEKVETDMLIATQSGMVIRVDTKQIPKLGRATLGVKLIKIKGNDKVTSVALIEDR
jgi:DNA gyrase subunit A